LRTPRNSGTAAARNLGAREAAGHFLCFLNADDRLDATFIEKAMLLLWQKPRVSWVYPHIQYFDGDSGLQPTMNPFNFFSLLSANSLPYCALIRREHFAEAGGYDEALTGIESADWDFWLRMGKRGFVGHCIPEPLFLNRKAQNLRQESAGDGFANNAATLRRRHRELFRPAAYRRLQWRWSPERMAALANGEPAIPPWVNRWQWPIRGVIARFHAAELVDTEPWRRSPGRCLLLMVPSALRRALNALAGRRIVPEHIRFSSFFQPDPVTAPGNDTGKLLASTPLPALRRRPTVLLFQAYLPLGGVETLMLNIISNLADEFDFVIVTSLPDRNCWHSAFARTATVYHLPNMFETHEQKLDFVRHLVRKHAIRNALSVNSVFSFEIIHDLKTEFPDLSMSTSLHGWDPSFDFLTSVEMHIQHLERVVCCSEWVLRHCREARGNDPKVVLVRNTIDYDRMLAGERGCTSELECMRRDSPDCRNVVFVGRYNPDKRPHLFMDIADHMVCDLGHRHLRFVMAGEGCEGPSLRARAADINAKAGHSLVFVHERQDEVAIIYRQADVFINCSPNEGFALATVEAAFFGVPVVAFDIGIFNEVLPPGAFHAVPQAAPNPLPLFAKHISAASLRRLSPEEKNAMRQWILDRMPPEPFYESYRRLFRGEHPEL
ncbi:MAG: glycosyltransferase, partial [bacterium]